QTQSAHVYTLVHELEVLRALGVDVVRLSPQSQHMEEVVDGFRSVLNREDSALEVHAALVPRMPAAPCNGYWHGRPGLDMILTAANMGAEARARDSRCPRRRGACWPDCPDVPARR